MKWFTGDQHLGEKRLEIMDRPFKTTDDFVNALIENHNTLVSPTDEVIFTGDMISMSADKPEDWLAVIGKFNGKKTLIRGNHDRQFTDEQFKPYFDLIVPEGDGIEMEVEEIPCFVTHYPTLSKVDKFNLVGHIHGAWKIQLNMLNVGIDVHHFRPVPSPKVAFYFKGIHDFYDEDAFCADNHANICYKGLRGKKGSRFPAE